VYAGDSINQCGGDRRSRWFCAAQRHHIDMNDIAIESAIHRGVERGHFAMRRKQFCGGVFGHLRAQPQTCEKSDLDNCDGRDQKQFHHRFLNLRGEPAAGGTAGPPASKHGADA